MPHRTRNESRTKGRRDSRGRYWSAEVMRTSDALDLEHGVFKRGPRAIAASLKRSAERSRRRKGTSYQSAMSMLTFYANRAGRGLGRTEKARLERAKLELRRLYGRPAPLGRSRTSNRSRKRAGASTKGRRRTSRARSG